MRLKAGTCGRQSLQKLQILKELNRKTQGEKGRLVLRRSCADVWVGNLVGNSDVLMNSDVWSRSTHAPGMRPGILTGRTFEDLGVDS